RARRKQRVGAGQVDQLELLLAGRERALGPRDRLARPVAGVLAPPRERVEHRALAGVRIAGQRHDVVVPGHVDAELLEIRDVVRRAGGAGFGGGVTHDALLSASGASPRWTWIRSACSRRSAISAPRMR